MTGGAHLVVDLEAALQRRPVIGAEEALEGPVLVLQRRLFGRRGGGAGQADDAAGRGKCDQGATHQAFSIGRARAPAAMPPPLRNGWRTLAGRGRGRSKTLSSGSRTRRWATESSVPQLTRKVARGRGGEG